MSVAQHLLIAALRIYRATLSPLLALLCGGLGLGCRFSPTCSQYALEAVQKHGAWKGILLAGHRLARCHPWGGSGYDPVPGHKHSHISQFPAPGKVSRPTLSTPLS